MVNKKGRNFWLSKRATMVAHLWKIAIGGATLPSTIRLKTRLPSGLVVFQGIIKYIRLGIIKVLKHIVIWKAWNLHKKQKQASVLRLFSWRTAFCYCSPMEASCSKCQKSVQVTILFSCFLLFSILLDAATWK